MSVERLLESFSSQEVAEWMAFSRIEPFGEERADLRSAVVACVIANANRGKNQRPFKIDDFVLKFGQKKAMSDNEIKRALGFG